MPKQAVGSRRGTRKKKLEANISLLSFLDEGVHIVYSPDLDLSGYGYTETEAKKSFKVTLNEFFRYAIQNDTLLKELTRLGWKISGNKLRPKVSPPELSSLIYNNEDLQRIYDKKDFRKFRERIEIPEL